MPANDQGLDRVRYSLVPRTLIFLTRGERVLLIRGAPHKRLWAGLYNGIGGHVERGESVLACARRELLEETGLVPETLWLCGVIIVDVNERQGVGIYVLRGESPQGEPKPSTEGQLHWLEQGSISELPLVEDLHVLLPHILAAQPEDLPFSAYTGYAADGSMQVRIDST